jgi:hypothetical protein
LPRIERESVTDVPLQSGQHLRRRIERGDDPIALYLGQGKESSHIHWP